MNRPLAGKALMGLLQRALRRAGIDKRKVTLHTLRHTFACLMRQGGCGLFTLSRLMGHTRLDTTATYVHATLVCATTVLLTASPCWRVERSAPGPPRREWSRRSWFAPRQGSGSFY